MVSIDKNNWQKFKINDLIKSGEILEIQDGNHGGLHPTVRDYVTSGERIPFIMANNIRDNHIDLINCKFISKTLADKLRIGFAKTGDLLFTHKGTVGQVATVKNMDYPYIMLTPQVTYYRINREKINPDFLSFYFRSPNYQTRFKNFNAQSTRAYVGITAQKQLEIEIPDFPIQDKIASILSSYDNLIENNEQRIKILEEMEQLLYTEWFVKFKFPGHEKVKMIDSGTEYGMIPEGWEIKPLGAIADLIMGQSPTSNNYNLDNQGLPFHQGVADFGYKYPIDRVYSTAGNKYAERGDLLFSVRAPVGRMNIANKKIILGRGLSAIRHKEGFQSFLCLTISNKFTEKDMIGNGAIYKSVNKAELEGLKFVVPTPDILECFDNIESTYFLDIEKMSSINMVLSKTRDLLIPQLVTGKRTLKD